jgi:hypothetical protein
MPKLQARSYSKPRVAKAKKSSKVKARKSLKKNSKTKARKSSKVKARKTSKRKSSKSKSMKRVTSYNYEGPGVRTRWTDRTNNPIVPQVGELHNGHTGTNWLGTEVDWS